MMTKIHPEKRAEGVMAEDRGIGKADDIAEGTMVKVVVDGREVLVARVGDDLYAMDNRCPHMGGDLSQGTLEGTIVTCPRHGSQFDLTDGHVIRWTAWTGITGAAVRLLKPPRPLTTYPVRVDDTELVLTLEK
jgi:3-phenylpropionate/trans-cinnamate dioxygenase ferredoxin subunit